MRRTAFGGTVKGTVVQATSTGVIMKLTTGEVRSIHAVHLDPIKAPATRALPGGRRKRVQPAATSVKAAKVKSAKPAASRVTVERVERDTRNDLQKFRHLFSEVTDRTQYADK